MSGRRVAKGDHLVISDRTGFTVPASKTRRQWDGLIVEDDKFESEHPQEKRRAIRDNQSVPNARPRNVDIAVGALMTTLAADAAAGATSITVESTERMLAGDRVGIFLDSKDLFRAQIQSVTSDTELTISELLPGPVSEGNKFINYTAVALQGPS